MSRQYTELEKAVLRKLITYKNASTVCSRKVFADMLCEMGIERWLPFLKPLCEDGVIRLDQPNDSRKELVFEPTKKAFEVLGLI
jgi:hypothetical protein